MCAHEFDSVVFEGFRALGSFRFLSKYKSVCASAIAVPIFEIYGEECIIYLIYLIRIAEIKRFNSIAAILVHAI